MSQKLSAFLLLAAFVPAAHAQQTVEPLGGQTGRSTAAVVLIAPFGGGYLGVQVLDITRENFDRYGLRDVRGIAVDSVAKDSPAARAGLQKDDVIVAVNGETVTSVAKLSRLLREIAPDHQAKITVLRGGAESELTATLVKRPLPEFPERVFRGQPPLPPDAPNFPRVPMMSEGVFQLPDDPNLLLFRSRAGRQIGINVTDLTAQLAEFFGVSTGKGLLVNKVAEDSPAARAGIEAGDVIVEADGKPIANNLELLRALDEKKVGDIILTIVRDKTRRSVTVTPETSKDAPVPSRSMNAPLPPNK